jgi:hypothetical protein
MCGIAQLTVLAFVYDLENTFNGGATHQLSIAASGKRLNIAHRGRGNRLGRVAARQVEVCSDCGAKRLQFQGKITGLSRKTKPFAGAEPAR